MIFKKTLCPYTGLLIGVVWLTLLMFINLVQTLFESDQIMGTKITINVSEYLILERYKINAMIWYKMALFSSKVS